MAVGQNVRQRKFLQTAGPGRLNDAHIGDIMRNQGIELQLQLSRIGTGVVSGQNPIGDRLFASVGKGPGLRVLESLFSQAHRMPDQFNHSYYLLKIAACVESCPE